MTLLKSTLAAYFYYTIENIQLTYCRIKYYCVKILICEKNEFLQISCIYTAYFVGFCPNNERDWEMEFLRKLVGIGGFTPILNKPFLTVFGYIGTGVALLSSLIIPTGRSGNNVSKSDFTNYVWIYSKVNFCKGGVCYRLQYKLIVPILMV